MKKILLGILLIPLFFTGCKKNITEKPYSFLTADNFPNSAAETDAALVACYTTLKGAGNDTWNYAGGLYMNSQNDNIIGPGNWSRFLAPTHGQETQWWKAYWQGINAANNLIAILEAKDAATDTWVTVKMAEARAIRAFLYHNLASLFGDLPLRLKPTFEIVLKVDRSPVTEIYKQIILPDLEFADGKLPVKSNSGGRITAGPLKCIMADVYMKLAGWRRSSQGTMIAGDPKYWAMARDAADSVLSMEANGVYALEPEYSQVFIKLSTDVVSKEVIFDLDFTALAGSNFPYIYGAGPSADPGRGGGNNNSHPLPVWLRTRDNKDERFKWNIADYYFSGWNKIPQADTTVWGITTFQKIFPSTGYWMDHLTNWPFFRLAEVKLLYAEAANEAEGGPSAKAYAQLNAVRYRARPAANKTDGTVLPDLTGLTQAQFREAIMEERAMELICEGKRHLDLVRWGNLKEKVLANLSPAQVTAINDAGGFNDRFYLWAVPTSEVTTNTWQNNAGY